MLGHGLFNGAEGGQFNLKLADAVATMANAPASFPIVIGGDCSSLPGALAECRRQAPLSLVQIDGHSDFRPRQLRCG
ncbi:arginase family protein [Microvirga sp. GCM10011540]|uniref:arginase family protein n=1 Tax=Microvirga sp. GCM10011540 TaxID=3317338 RepID=UPI0036192FF4